MDNRGKQIAKQGAILAIASFVVRIIGVLYRIPMTNILGKEVMGYYSYAFNIYMYMLIISSYAMPTAISKIISEKIALKRRKEAHHLFQASLLLNFIISSFFSVLLFLIAKPYAEIISVPGVEIVIKYLAPALLIFGVMSSFRGYFQGMHTMIPTAISQVVEQIFNAIFSIVFSYLLISKGVEYAAAGGTIGTGVGAFASLVFLIFVYFAFRKRLSKSITRENPLHLKDIPNYWKSILMLSIPMVIGTATFNVSTIIDDMMFSRALVFHNYSNAEITTLNGILNAQYTLIITMPIAIATALATASIPSISASVALKDFQNMKKKIKATLKGIVLISLPASVGIFVLAGPILKILFKMDQFEKVTTDMLRIGAITVFFFSVSTLSIGILQGLGYVKIPVKSAIKSIIIKSAFNFLVFYALDLNLYGAAIANIVFSFVSAFFNLSAVLQKAKIRLNYTEVLWKPLGATILMGGVTYLSYRFMDIFLPENYLGNLVATLVTILIAIVAYFILILKLTVVDLEELKELPYGNVLWKVAKKIV